MKIVVVNGTETQGVTARMKEIFLEPFRNQSGGTSPAEITEFFLPRDCPGFCAGCKICFLRDEKMCKDAPFIQALERSMLAADLLVFVSPAYVFHATGAMKVMLDHFGYRWMPHRPAEEMFGKRAVVLTQCLGAGAGSAAKDIRDSLSWWGVSEIRVCRFRLMEDILWERLSDRKRKVICRKLTRLARRMLKEDDRRPARTHVSVKLKFLAVRMLQKQVGKTRPNSKDYLYWQEKGWLGSRRPWPTRGGEENTNEQGKA